MCSRSTNATPLWIASLLLLMTGAWAAAQAPTPVAADAFARQIQPLLKQHCLSCHGPDAQEGGVSYDDLKDDKTALRRRNLWKRAVLRVKAGEMPPEGETPLTAEEKKTLVDWMTFATE